MSQPVLNQRLTSIDASFLYFEKKEAPMHIGSVNVFEGDIPFDAFVENIASKMHLLPRYQQKVVFAPFNVGHPTWEFDPAFDIRKHIFKLQLDPPGGEKELRELAGRLFTEVMDRDKPLWEIFVVYGLEGGRSAFVAKVHHAMVDGMSGIDLIKIILDISPEPPPPPPKPDAPPTPPPPDLTRRFFDSVLSSAQEGMTRWMEFQTGLLNLAQTFAAEPGRLPAQGLGQALPAVTSPPALLPFNRPCSGQRLLAWSEFSFAEARAIRAALGGTVNDVVLTVLSGAISRYVEMHGQKTAGRSVRIMVPVSMRKEEQRGALGNLVSLLPVEIPLDLREPVARFKYINQKTSSLKQARIAEGLNLMSALAGMLPPPVQAFVGALANTPIPAINIVSTNVPGPQVPLYTVGQRMVAYHPYVPVGYAVGCGCAIVSYDQKLYFGLTSDLHAMPDVERLKEFLDQSFAELRQAAGVPEIKPQVVEAPKPPSRRKRRQSSGGK